MSHKRSYRSYNFGLKAVRTRRLVLFTAMVFCGVLIAGALYGDLAGVQTNSTPRHGFVSRQGTHFFLDGKPLFVAGVNNHYLTFGSKAEVERVLDDAVAMHATVVRTFIQPVIGSLDGVTQPTIWDWKRLAQSSDLGVHGNYLIYWDPSRNGMAFNEAPNGMQKLDFLVKEAA
jgi:mannan endo-1,4-beta-mannosidase